MTDKKKQIEEMAKDVTGSIVWRSFEGDFLTVDGFRTAEALYEIGYRKQRYGENLTENHPVDEFICSECGLITRQNTSIEIDEDADGDEAECELEIKFCPRCGVKIKGGESDD